MKKQPIYQIDAFSSELFGGNLAAVCTITRVSIWSRNMKNSVAEVVYRNALENSLGINFVIN